MGSGPLLPKFYLDEDVDARLASALAQSGLDILTTVAAGLVAASDEQQLTFAVQQERALVTHNIKHFPSLHAAWIEADREHWGIIVLIGHSAIGIWLRRIETLIDRYSIDQLRNGLFFLGAEFDE
ncbi:MAG: DUF5615 family PIN-like protein [Anaerolineales bacterium]|nr:DUF5615 family PIN-like protein [Anaerolineales bacterium]